jgi:hypothetical protein
VYGSSRPGGPPGQEYRAPEEEQPPGQYGPGQRDADESASSQEFPFGSSSGPLLPDASGSLTGHILAQGRPEVTGALPRRGSRMVIILLAVVLIVSVAVVVGAVLVISGTL